MTFIKCYLEVVNITQDQMGKGVQGNVKQVNFVATLFYNFQFFHRINIDKSLILLQFNFINLSF